MRGRGQKGTEGRGGMEYGHDGENDMIAKVQRFKRDVVCG